MSTSAGPSTHAPWHQVHAKLQLATNSYKTESAAAIARLQKLNDRTTDLAMRARYAEMMSAQTQKQCERDVECARKRQGLMAGLDQPLKMMRQMRVEGFVGWLEERVEEMKGVGVEDRDYVDVDPEEAVEGFEHVDVEGAEDAEDAEDGVETRERRGGWVGVV